jgi:hypothetical protein
LELTKITVDNTKQRATRGNWEKRIEAEDITKKGGIFLKNSKFKEPSVPDV